MSYQQGHGPGAPYPHQGYAPPTRGPPYPSQSPYPSINPNSFGFPGNTPMQMPQPMAMPIYPPSAPPPAHVPANSVYPPNTYPTGYPPSLPAYPPTTPGHPPAHPAPGAAPGGCHAAQKPYGGLSHTPNQAGSGSEPAKPQRTPTVVAAQPFNPRADAEVLRKAMKGFGTDEKAIINVLAHRTNGQRLQIAIEFKTLYGKDLVKDLKSETSGNFQLLLAALMLPLPKFYAKSLHDAMAGLGTQENVLIEVLCTKSNQELEVIKQAYQAVYCKPLEADIKGDTGGTFKRLMVALCNAGRDESMLTNPEAARADAQALLRAGELRLGTDESVFNAVLCQRNWAQLQLIFHEYRNLTGHDIEKAIQNEFSGEAEDGLLALVQHIRNAAAFYAKLLRRSMKGMGTDDEDLIRLVVTRSEIDMVEVKREYQALYGASLADSIKDETSGDYKKCLLHLIGES